MIEISAQKVVVLPASATEVWELLADFGGIAKWWPEGGLEKVETEGDGIGMVRHMHTTVGLVLSERLDGLDRDQLTINLSIIAGLPFDITDYNAIGRVLPTSDSQSTLDWRGTFKIPNTEVESGARAVIEGAYDAQAAGLLEHFSK